MFNPSNKWQMNRWPGINFSAGVLLRNLLLLGTMLVFNENLARANRGNAPRFGTPVLFGDKLLFAEPGIKPRRLICISKDDGRKLWEITDGEHELKPWFVLDNQFIVSVGMDIKKCDPISGKLRLLYRTGFDEGGLLLDNQQDGHILIYGATSNVAYLTCLDSHFKHVLWNKAHIEMVVAYGQNALLCDVAIRKPADGGGFGPYGERWVALSKNDSKPLWSCAPFAKGIAISNYFLVYLKDTIFCLREQNGAKLTEIKTQLEPYALLAFAANKNHLLVNTYHFVGVDQIYTRFSLSVPDLNRREITKEDWDDAFIEFWAHDDRYRYLGDHATDSDDDVCIVRLEVKTGHQEQLYRETLPPELRRKPNLVK